MFERDQHRPKKPLVTTLTSANAEFRRWLEHNSPKEHRDALGLLWTVTPEHHTLPDPVNRHASRYQLGFTISTVLNRKLLLEHGILDASKDQRLLDIWDDSTITFIYQRRPLESDKLDKLRSQGLEDLAKIRERLKTVDISALCRKAVGQQANRRFAMTYPPVSAQQIKIDLEV